MIKKIMVLLLIIIAIEAMAISDGYRWRLLGTEYCKEHPYCEVCGTSKDIQIHHKKPVYLYPELEFEKSNLITLCKSKYWGFHCHLVVGHGGNFKYENPWIDEDIKALRVLASPEYIRDHGEEDREAYIKMMRARCKQYHKERKGG